MKKKNAMTAKRVRIKSPLIVFLGFLAVMFVGAFFMALPISNTDGKWMSFTHAVFWAMNGVCGTGLIVKPTALELTGFGQAVLLILIQFGGLGFMTLATFVFILIRRRITFKDRVAIQEALGENQTKGVVRLVRNIMIMTAVIEAAGTLMLIPFFCVKNGAIGVWQALFNSISAFCNAGFDVCGTSSNPYGSLTDYNGNAGVLLIISLLSILGAFGFTVINDILRNKFRFKRYRLHTKLVLLITPILMLSGTFFFLASEWNADATAGMNGGQKLLNSLFQSVMASSTAGFSSLDQTKLSPAGVIYTCILMFIGSSPGGTGGGIKTTTFALLFWMAVSGLRGKEEIIMFKHSINIKTGLRAIAVAALALIVVFTGALIISASDSYLLIKDVFFETLTAFTTTGLSMGSTTTLNPNISSTALYVLSVVMFIGRLGPLSVGMIFAKQDRSTLKYPASSLMIG